MSWLTYFTLEDLLLMGLFLVLCVAFIRDFRLAHRRSWLMLAALTGMGLIFWRKNKRRMELLKALQELEQKYKEQEANLERLREEQKITEEAYRSAKEELNRVRKEAELNLARLDQELAEKLKEIEKNYEDLSFEEIVNLIERELRQ